MKYVSLLIFITVLGCNTIGLLTNTNSGVDDGFGQSEDIEQSLERDLFGYWNFEQSDIQNKNSSFGSVDLSILSPGTSDTKNPTPVALGPRGSSLDCTVSGSFGAGQSALNSTQSFFSGSGDNFTISFFIRNEDSTAIAGAQEAVILEFENSIPELNQIFVTKNSGPGEPVDLGVHLPSNGTFIFQNVLGSTTFHHIAMVFNQSNLSITVYRDGSFLERQFFSTPFILSNSDFSVCSCLDINTNCSAPYSSAGDTKYEGYIDSLGLWQRALTEEQIDYLARTYTNLD